MATLQHIGEGLGEAWDNLMGGWRKLYRRAAGAITRFTPADKAGTDGDGRAQRRVGSSRHYR